MDNKDFYQERMAGGAVFHGGVMMQAKGEIGGTKHVFVMTTRAVRNGFDYPPIGGRIVNPFPGRAKVFAGDVCEYTDAVADTANGATIKILKTYEVAADTAGADDTVIYIVRDGYKHIPFAGDNIMVGAAKFTTRGKGVTVKAVEATVKGGKNVIIDEDGTMSVDVADVSGDLAEIKKLLDEIVPSYFSWARDFVKTFF